MANPTPLHEPVHLTKSIVDRAGPADREYVLWDDEIKGFGLKVTPSGKKVFLLKYRTGDGVPRKPTIGRFGNITVDKARTTAKDWCAKVTLGGDPSGERRAARQTVPTADPAFSAVLDDFVTKWCKVKQKENTWREVERTLRVNCASWISRPISTITKRDAYALLDGFIADGHGPKARVTLAWLRKMWRWASTRDLVEAPLMDAVEIDYEENVRDRVYSNQEVKAVWDATKGLEPLEAGFVKLIVLLGVRKNELSGMRRSEFDDPENPKVWTIPFERTKTRKTAKRRVYIVPLPPWAQRIIKSLPRRDYDLVFPGRRRGTAIDPGTPLSRKVRKGSGVSDWAYHPNRDTISTWLQTQGRTEAERGLVLNHSESSVTSKYSHGFPIELKRELLEQWADHVESLLQPEGIAQLT